MRRAYQKLRLWCLRNKRNNLVLLTFTCALCMLLWQRPSKDVDTTLRDIPTLPDLTQIPRHDFFKTTVPEDATYIIRRDNVIQQCRQKHGSSWTSSFHKLPKFRESPIISTKHRLMYCPVGKVASSFFTRFVLALNKPDPMTSPFDIPIEQAGRNNCESFKHLGSKDKISRFLKNATTIVFGRNPYSRIFSAFVDKMLSPNPFYWKYWGEKVLRLEKRKLVAGKCASDVSFPQFVHLVIRHLHKNDVHLRQVVDECRMCDLVYDVTGQLETTQQDMTYILTKLNKSSSFLTQASYSFDCKMDIVYDSVRSAFQWKRDIAHCISLDEMGLRIWRKLQIRGVFQSSIAYPFRSGEMEHMPVEKFIRACQEAILASSDSQQLKRQKEQALREAYLAVSKENIMALQRLYKDDFNMFGYDSHPSWILSDQRHTQNTGALAFRKTWIV